jgi:hypothetical protein
MNLQMLTTNESCDSIANFKVNEMVIDVHPDEKIHFKVFDGDDWWVTLDYNFLLFDRIRTIIQKTSIESELMRQARIAYSQQVHNYDTFLCQETMTIFRDALYKMAKVCYSFLPALNIYTYSFEEVAKELIAKSDNTWGYINAFENTVQQTFDANYSNYVQKHNNNKTMFWSGFILGGWAGTALMAASSINNPRYSNQLSPYQKEYLFSTINHEHLLLSLQSDLHRMYINLMYYIRGAGINVWIPSVESNKTITNIINNIKQYNLQDDAQKQQVIEMMKMNPYDVRVPQAVVSINIRDGYITQEEWENDIKYRTDDVASMAHYINGL